MEEIEWSWWSRDSEGPSRSGSPAPVLQLSDHVVAVTAETLFLTPGVRRGDLEAFITLVLSDPWPEARDRKKTRQREDRRRQRKTWETVLICYIKFVHVHLFVTLLMRQLGVFLNVLLFALQSKSSRFIKLFETKGKYINSNICLDTGWRHCRFVPVCTWLRARPSAEPWESLKKLGERDVFWPRAKQNY